MDYTYFSTAAAGPTPNQSFHPYGGGLPAPPHDQGHQTHAVRVLHLRFMIYSLKAYLSNGLRLCHFAGAGDVGPLRLKHLSSL